MARLADNEQLRDPRGRPLGCLAEINRLARPEKEEIYWRIIPRRLSAILATARGARRAVGRETPFRFVAPQGLGFVRIDAHRTDRERDPVFLLDIADTHFRQMDLSFCIINDLNGPRFNVDLDDSGRDNCFASMGRNIPEEVRAMTAGLFPHQTHRGLGLFAEFFPLFERFVDALGMEMIVAEPLTYANAIRYEKYGFDYLAGRRLMQRINEGFKPGGDLFSRLDGSTPFRQPGMELTVHGRSWAIHDGVLDEPWDGVRIYKMIGEDAGVDTFPERRR